METNHSLAELNNAHDFTVAAITKQKDIAFKLSSKKHANVYIFDQINYFANCERKNFGNIIYLKKSNKYAVLSSAQAVLKNVNEYLQFNSNKDDIGVDNIGVFVKFGTK